MARDFYSSETYRAKQSERTRLNWQIGKMDFLRRGRVYVCKRSGCSNTFNAIPSDRKSYCSQKCAAIQNNTGRIQSTYTRERIRQALAGRRYPDRPKKPPRTGKCLRCGKKFIWKLWRPASRPYKYCSRICLIKDVGSRPTSSRAARAKAGIRKDISPTIYFFSRWEANYARVLNYLGLKWIHQPKTFQLETQKYTPDFYLPESNTYV